MIAHAPPGHGNDTWAYGRREQGVRVTTDDRPLVHTHRIDDLGRVVIPRVIRDAAGFPDGTLLVIELTDAGVLIRAAEPEPDEAPWLAEQPPR